MFLRCRYIYVDRYFVQVDHPWKEISVNGWICRDDKYGRPNILQTKWNHHMQMPHQKVLGLYIFEFFFIDWNRGCALCFFFFAFSSLYSCFWRNGALWPLKWTCCSTFVFNFLKTKSAEKGRVKKTVLPSFKFSLSLTQFHAYSVIILFSYLICILFTYLFF